jgi:hypothetical protein
MESSLTLSSDGDTEETTSEMGSGIGKEPRKPQQRGGMGLLMKRLITSVLRRRGMFGCGRSLAGVVDTERFQEIKYTYNSIITSMYSITPKAVSESRSVRWSNLQAQKQAQVPINPYIASHTTRNLI